MEEKQILKLSKLYRAHPTTKNRNELVAVLTPIVNNIAAKFFFRGESKNDIIQVGMIGLLKAIEYFRTAYKSNFIPYVISMVIGEIKHYFRDKVSDIRLPRKYIELSYNINAYIQKYIQKHKGRKPTIKEISKTLAVSPEQILETIEALHVSSLINNDNKFLKDLIPKNNPENHKDFTENLDTLLFIENIMKTLPYREQKILQMYFLRNSPQRDIARRFKISQAQVYRILNRALEHCKTQLQRESHLEKDREENLHLGF